LCLHSSKSKYLYDEAKASKGPLSNIPARQLMIGEFKDVRPERDKIGYKRNGYGMKTADIVTQKPVPEIVREAVTAEFSKNGHATAAKTPELVLAGEVNTFWFDTQINFWSVEFMGTVSVDLNLTDATRAGPCFESRIPPSPCGSAQRTNGRFCSRAQISRSL
jgi:hypothetical protein